MIKLICIDMDGTLLNDEKQISSKDIETLRGAYKRGIKVAICTGRLFSSASVYEDIIGVKCPIIAGNGAAIKEASTGEVIYKSPLGIERCREALKVAKKYGLYPHFNLGDLVLTEKIIYSSKGYMDVNKTLPLEKRIKIQIVSDWDRALQKYGDEVLKCLISDDNLEKVAAAKEEMEKHKGVEVISSFYNNYEVMCEGVSKGRAVKILSSYYKIEKDEIMCIGDNYNDLSMIKYAGIGVAMGNGEQEVKNAADFITDTNNNSGVSKAVEKFTLQV